MNDDTVLLVIAAAIALCTLITLTLIAAALS